MNEETNNIIVENGINNKQQKEGDDNLNIMQTATMINDEKVVVMSDDDDDDLMTTIGKKKSSSSLNQELRPLQNGHQTRRIFVVGKNVAEFVLILKSKKLSIKKERVVNGQCCIQFKGPISTDLILRLLEESSLGLQLYSCKRAKGTFESFFSSFSSSSSSSSFECHNNSNKIPSICIENIQNPAVDNKYELNHSYFTSNSSSSASTERFVKALEQKRQQEELICLIKEQQLQQSQLLQQQLVHNEDERRVYDRILNIINENPLWRIPQVIEYFKQTNLEKITLIMHVLGKNKQILDNIISIYQEMNSGNTTPNANNDNENENENDDVITTSINQCDTQTEESGCPGHITTNKGIRKDLTESQLDKHKNRLLLLAKKSNNNNNLKVNKKKKKRD